MRSNVRQNKFGENGYCRNYFIKKSFCHLNFCWETIIFGVWPGQFFIFGVWFFIFGPVVRVFLVLCFSLFSGFSFR